MAISEAHEPFSVGVARPAAPAVALDAAFEIRSAAWAARRRAHEQRARRKFIVGAGVLAVAAAVGYAFLH